MAKYKGRIKNVTTDEWVSDETDGIVTMVKKKKEACVFNEESDAVSTLEMLNVFEK